MLGCTLLPSWYAPVASHFGEFTDTKAQCDELHLRKIDVADEVLVLNVGGYIGESTRNEIDYATTQGKPIRYLEAALHAAGGEMSQHPGVCIHGGLRRSCESCDLAERLEVAEEALRGLRAELVVVEEVLKETQHEYQRHLDQFPVTVTLEGLMAELTEAHSIIRGFINTDRNGVLCAVPEPDLLETPPHRTWCASCQKLWRRAYAAVAKRAALGTAAVPSAEEEPTS